MGGLIAIYFGYKLATTPTPANTAWSLIVLLPPAAAAVIFVLVKLELRAARKPLRRPGNGYRDQLYF